MHGTERKKPEFTYREPGAWFVTFGAAVINIFLAFVFVILAEFASTFEILFIIGLPAAMGLFAGMVTALLFARNTTYGIVASFFALLVSASPLIFFGLGGIFIYLLVLMIFAPFNFGGAVLGYHFGLLLLQLIQKFDGKPLHSHPVSDSS